MPLLLLVDSTFRNRTAVYSDRVWAYIQNNIYVSLMCVLRCCCCCCVFTLLYPSTQVDILFIIFGAPKSLRTLVIWFIFSLLRWLYEIVFFSSSELLLLWTGKTDWDRVIWKKQNIYFQLNKMMMFVFLTRTWVSCLNWYLRHNVKKFTSTCKILVLHVVAFKKENIFLSFNH